MHGNLTIRDSAKLCIRLQDPGELGTTRLSVCTRPAAITAHTLKSFMNCLRRNAAESVSQLSVKRGGRGARTLSRSYDVGRQDLHLCSEHYCQPSPCRIAI